MSNFRVHKVVAHLPDVLEKDAVYAVRTGAGFDLYVTDATGAHAHKLNIPDAAHIERYVQSRGSGLVTNGSGLLRDNTNFSRFRFDPTDGFVGYGCFTTDAQNFDGALDELIPVNPGSKYELSFAARTKVKGNNNLAYSFLVCCDADGLAITPDTQPRFSFRLAEPLTTGQSALKIHADDVAKIRLFFEVYGQTPSSAQLISYRYTSASGRPYLAGTYSRTRYTRGNVLMSALRLDGDTLSGFTLASGVALQAGDTVSFSMAGSTYLYGMYAHATAWEATATMYNAPVPEEWAEYRMRFTLRAMLPVLRANHGRLADTNLFPNLGDSMAAATAGVKVGWLLNRGGVRGNVTAISAVNFREI